MTYHLHRKRLKLEAGIADNISDRTVRQCRQCLEQTGLRFSAATNERIAYTKRHEDP